MAQTVAEILVDQMVEVGIRKVYGIVGDSANPIVDALRRHESRHRVRARPQRGGGRLRRRCRRPDLGPSDRRPRVVGAGQPAPAQRPLRLPAQRGARCSPSPPTSRAPRSAAATSRRPTPRRSSPAAPTTCALISIGRPDAPHLRARAAGGHPRARRRHDHPARRRRGPEVEHADAAPPGAHRPAGDPARRDEALDKAVAADRRGQEDRDPRRRGHPQRPRRGARALARRSRPRSPSPTAARTCSRPTTRPASG